MATRKIQSVHNLGKNSKKPSDMTQIMLIFRFEPVKALEKVYQLFMARWGFQGQYHPSLSINYAATNKDLETLSPQLY